MKSSNTYKKLRKTALGFLRDKPKCRLIIRRIYWGLRKIQYDIYSSRIYVNSKYVFFESYGGRSVSCSPKAIYLEMIQDDRFSDYIFIWSLRSSAEDAMRFLGEIDTRRTRVVVRGSTDYFAALAKASCIIVNSRLPEYIYPKANQVYVQCWHGTPLKKLGYDAIGKTDSALNTPNELALRFRIDSEKWNYLVSPSRFTSTALFSAFGVEENKKRITIEEGYPRNDFLISSMGDVDLVAKIKRELGIPIEKKVALYAPTWRDDKYVSGVGYTTDVLLDFKEMQDSLADDWVLLFRAHYYIAEAFDFEKFGSFVIDASAIMDINDLYIISDALITDYSSTIFDFALLRRPIFLYVPDRYHYENMLHGFYLELEDLPVSICNTTNDVVSAINIFEDGDFKCESHLDDFLRVFSPHEDGLSASRVINRIFKEKT